MFHRAGLAAKGLIFIVFLILVGCGGGSSVNSACANHVNENMTLDGLDVDSYDFGFTANVLNGYSVDVENDVTSVSIIATLNETALASGAKITANINAASSLTESTTQAIISGAAFDVALNEGDNFIQIEIKSSNGCQTISYDLVVHRKNSNAILDAILVLFPSGGGLTYDHDNNSSTSLVTFSSSTFDETVFNYDITATYATCYIAIAPYPIETRTTITVNDEEATRSAYSFFNLPLDGSTTSIVIKVDSEVGGNSQTYTFNVTRVSTDAELAADATLQDMQLSTTLSSDYSCATGSYFSRMDRAPDDASLEAPAELTLTPSVEGVSLTITQVPYYGQVATFADDTVITADTPFDLQVSPETGVYQYEITVTSTDASVTNVYSLFISRSETRWVNVSTAEELQQAIKDAQDYDEIVIEYNSTIDQYLGVVGLADSGSDEAHFYASASPENKVIIRGDGTGTVLLKGDDLSEKTVLLITGDNWEVKDISISGAANGVELVGASDNFISDLIIASVGERGVYIHGGSSNNVFANSIVSSTGISVVDGDEEYRGEGVVVGDAVDSLVDDNNVISRVYFYQNILSEIIDVNPSALNTKISHNRLVTSGIDPLKAEQNSLISVSGNDTDFTYNAIYHSNNEAISSVITLSDNATGARIFKNPISLGGLTAATITLLEGTAASYYVNNEDENLMFDGTTLSIVGSGVASLIDKPLYRIKSTVDTDRCLAQKTDVSVDLGTYLEEDDAREVSYDMLVMETCLLDAPSQQWELFTNLTVGTDSLTAAYVRIRNVETGFSIAPVSSTLTSSLNFLNTYDDASTSLYLWQLRKQKGNEDTFSFLSALDTSYGISETTTKEIEQYFVDGEHGTKLDFFSGSQTQIFELELQ